MKNHNTKNDCTKRHHTDFILPVLMSLGCETRDENVSKRISEIENDVCEILDISADEIYDFHDATPKITIMRSKLDLAIYEMYKEKLIQAEGVDAYSITEKGKQALFA